MLGDADVVQSLRRHPLARALRVDKLTIAALEASVRGPATPVTSALHASADDLRPRVERLAGALGRGVVAVDGRVGGGGAPGLPLPGWAIEVPVAIVERLRMPPADVDVPVVLARVDDGRGLVDLRCVPADRDGDVEAALRNALGVTGTAGAQPPSS